MTLKEILLGGGGIFLLLCTLIQITPLEINPWSWIANIIGKGLNKGVIDKLEVTGGTLTAVQGSVQELDTKLDSIDTKVKSLDSKVHGLEDKVKKLNTRLDSGEARNEERYILNCRARILRFGDEILHDQKHSKEHFDQILLDCTDYENYCQNHKGFKNNITSQTIEIIKSSYRKCMKDKSFL